MTKLDDDVRLRHMLNAAEKAQAFMQDRSREDLDSDPMLLLAVVKTIEIVGEAAARVTKERQTAIPEIPWPQIVSMRNRLIHAYFDINTQVVWKTVIEDLPPLIQQLQAAIYEK